MHLMRISPYIFSSLLAAAVLIVPGCGGGVDVNQQNGNSAAPVASSPPATQPVPPAPPGSGSISASLQWEAPVSPIDGLPLSSVTGYRIYYGMTSGNYTSSLDAGNVLTYALAGMAPGTYYFAVTAYDSSHMESAYSNEVSKTI